MNDLVQLAPPERPLRRRLSAIAFLDVAGYARLVADNEYATLRAWATLRRAVIEPRIQTWRGRIVDRAGDGIFAEFSSALEALLWARDVQNAVAHHPHEGEPIRLRIALHLADIIDGPDGEVQGDGVNIVARLQTHTEAGGVIVSESIFDAVKGKTDAGFVDLGQIRLRNLRYPVHAFRLGETPSGFVSRTRRAWLPVSAAASLGLLALLMLPDWRANPRERAEQFLRQGLAIKCPAFPCGAEWLQQRDLFSQAIAADPGFARPYAELAQIHTFFVSSRLTTDRKEDLRIGAELATRAVALAPDNAFAHNARASVLRQDPDRLEEALAAYFRVLALDPGQTVARANTGFILLLLGRPEEAEPYVRAALEAEPGHIGAPAWLNRLGLIDLFLSRAGNGAEHFRQAIARQSPGDAGADQGMERTINLAAALALGGDVDRARRLIDYLRRRYPALSTNNIWSCVCARTPIYMAGMERLKSGAILAGVSDYNQNGNRNGQGPLQ